MPAVHSSNVRWKRASTSSTRRTFIQRGVSEEVTGRALKDFAKRDEVVIATKVHGKMGDKPNQGGLSRKHIMHAIDDSLRRLGTDYVDLYQIHRWSDETPIEETLEALHDVVKAGKARYIGASSMYAWQFAQGALSGRPARLDALRLDAEPLQPRLPRGRTRNDPALPRSKGRRHPLESAGARFLGGQPHAGQKRRNHPLARATDSRTVCTTTDNDFATLDQVEAVASDHGVTPAQIALAWMLHKPAITSPIIGASKMPHLDESIAALAIKLSDAEIAQLEAPYQPHPILGH